MGVPRNWLKNGGIMSEWFEVKKADNVDLSDDGKFFHILFQTNRNGNRYVEVPVEILVKLLAASVGAKEDHLAKLNVDINIIPAWHNVVSDNGDIDVMPTAEEHQQGAECKCRPTVEVKGAYLLVIHNSYDKREFIEQAIDIMNGGSNSAT